MPVRVREMEDISLCHWGASFSEDLPLVDFVYFIFTRMPDESYCRRLRSMLCLCDVF